MLPIHQFNTLTVSQRRLKELALGFYNRVQAGTVRSAYIFEIDHGGAKSETAEFSAPDKSIAYALRDYVRPIHHQPSD
jgi:hypothetical protein